MKRTIGAGLAVAVTAVVLSGCGMNPKEVITEEMRVVDSVMTQDVITDDVMPAEGTHVMPDGTVMADSAMPLPTYTIADVAAHATQSDCWTVIDGTVVDVTGFFGTHPGGDDKLVMACGKDATAMFESVKKHDPNGYAAMQKMKIGTLAD